jgi:tetratricopeptide (TPR) repeat protein
MNSCTYNDKENLWIVNVSATDEGVDIATEYIEYQKAKMTESNIMLMLGHLIVEAGDYNKAEKYFDAILHSSIPNDEEIACIYYNIGRVYRLKGQYDHALEYLNRAYVEHSKARPPRLVSAAKALNAMGIVHTEQKNVQQAIDSFESALKLYTKTIQGYHPDVAGTLINLGSIYCEQENFTNALSCFNRARKIYQCNLPPNHPNVATLLNNIGNLHYQQLKLDLALDAYQRALEINEKILPPNHPDIVRTRHNLSKVYTTLGDQQKAAFELERAPEYDLVAGYQFIDSTPTNSVPRDAMDIDNASKSKMDLIEINNY